MALSRIFQDEVSGARAIKRAAIQKQQRARRTTDLIRRNVGPTNAYGPGTGAPSLAGASLFLQQAQPSASRGGGGGGGGGGASGGRPAAPAAPAAPAPTLDLDAIRSALAAISAVFGQQQGQLTAEQEAATRAFKFLSEQFTDARAEELSDTKSQAAGRGLLRSGLYLKAAGDVSERYAKQKSAAQSERDARLRAISNTIANIKTQEKLARENEARKIAKDQVGTQEAIARAIKLV